MVDEQLRRAEKTIRYGLLFTGSCIGKEVGGPIIVTYHPHLNGSNKIMRKNLKHLQADQTGKLVFTPAPFASFRTTSNPHSHLVQSKLYPLQSTTGSYKYKTPCCQIGRNVKEFY